MQIGASKLSGLLWAGKAIDSLTDKEVFDAVKVIRETESNYLSKRVIMQANANKKDHRFNKMFSQKLPEMNPLFIQLRDNLENELKKRTGVQ